MTRDSRYRVEFNGKKYVLRGEKSLKDFLKDCEYKGIDVGSEVRVAKLYPLSMEKNQHNFMLISNICANTMHDMEMGDIEWDEKEYDRLYDLKREADEYFCLDLPVAWVDGKTYGRCKELITMAVEHRVAKCVEAGHLDYIQYC